MKPSTIVTSCRNALRWQSVALLVAMSATAAFASDAIEPVIRPVTTSHTAVIDGTTVAYQAMFAETPLGKDPDHPGATMSATTYLRTGVADAASRPVVFLFNGGPGASSTPLHLHALGPRRIMDPDQGHKESYIEDNRYSLLDAADLVFIDPVGAGLSRVMPDGNGRPYMGPDGDARMIFSFIQAWLKEHHREGSPLYIAGESYGTYRLATMMKFVGHQRIDGLIFISSDLDQSGMDETQGNDLPYINDLPTMAAAAWYHNKVDRHGQSLEDFVASAEAFAITDYATALQYGDTIAPERRTVIARKLASYIGLSADRIAAANLRISSEDYLNSLMADKDLRMGRLDERETGPLHAKAPRGVPTNDPSLHVSQKLGINDHYFRDELKVPTPGGGANTPASGMSMESVEAKYGAPSRRVPAVGGGSAQQPPITRWEYPGFVVYFENNRVIHTVVTPG